MKKTFLLVIAFLLGMTATVYSAPLKNMEVRLTQPDGQIVHCFASGDEFYNYLHDVNGFTIVKGDDGFYCYAMHDNQGQVVASPYRVGEVNPASVGLQPNVNISEAEYYRLRHEREQYIHPIQRPRDRELNRGRYNNLVVFIRFAGDTYHTTPYSTVDSMFNASNYESISLHNFFHHASYNQLDLRSYCYPIPDGETILSYEDIHPKEYYKPVTHQFQHDVGVAIYPGRLALACQLLKDLADIGHVEVAAQAEVLCTPVVATKERVDILQASFVRRGIA